MPVIPPPQHSTVEAIYLTYEQAPREERPYLGASSFGHECPRAHWYEFRWAHPREKLSGRKIRLFKTGDREEARIIDDLRAAGLQVFDQQGGFAALGGHLRGHHDGRVMGVIEAPKTPHLLECKTHNDSSFKKLLQSGIASKPGHYAQVQLYMHHAKPKLTRALYVAVNKNDDAIYIERVPYDQTHAEMLIQKAERLIREHKAPQRLHENPNAREAYVCGWCPAKGICHEGEWPRRNCRTCISATPIIDDRTRGAWLCEFWNKELTTEEQHLGCKRHCYLPSLVPGELVDADDEGRTLTYQLHNGTEWIDGVTE